MSALPSNYVICPNCGEEMGKYYFETRHQYECKDMGKKPVVSKSEIEKEMREHPWADREIAERIAKDHVKEQTKVYIVMVKDADPYYAWVSQVFSNRKKAEKYIQDQELAERYFINEYVVDE